MADAAEREGGAQEKVAQETARVQALEQARRQAEEAQRALEALRKFPRPAIPWTNSLGMVFLPVAGADVLFCAHEARVADFAQFGADSKLADARWKNPGFKQSSDHPVVYVNWEDANRFCAWLTAREHQDGRLRTNQVYRLPKDSEWSRAVGLTNEVGNSPRERSDRAKNQYPWGRWPPPVKNAGNYAGKEINGPNQIPKPSIPGYEDAWVQTAPVQQFAPAPNGLYDLGGNVWEWCEDPFDAQSADRVLRGGAWNVWERDELLSSHRMHFAPVLRLESVGFRCVLVVVPERATAP